MVNTIHTIHDGNHEDHHCAVKKTAAPFWNTKMARRFKTRVIARPIQATLSNAVVFFMRFGF
jgi:hypothetical protein